MTWALVVLIAVGAAVRFVGIGDQSYWFDETVTVEVIHPGASAALDALRSTDSSPPLYYALAWVWTRVFGDGEAGLRSLSALAGTLTVPVAWAAARELASRQAALLAAALVAVNPILVWYSQEARTYAVATLIAGVSAWLCLRARRVESGPALVGWAVAACLALGSHYFAIFVVAGEALLLLPAFRRRLSAAAVAVSAFAATGAGLAALASDQQSASWIGSIPLGDRVGDVARELVSANTDLIAVSAGEPSRWIGVLGAAGVFVAVAAGAVGWLRSRGQEPGVAGETRRALLAVAALVAAGIALPLLLGIVVDSRDYFLDRNLQMAAVPLAAGLAAWATVRGATFVGVAGVAIVCLAGLAADVQVQRRPDLQRADWRGLVRHDLGPPRGDRVIALVPGFAHAPLRVYGRAIGPLPATGLRVAEIDLAGNFVPGLRPVPRPPAGFALAGQRTRQQVALVRYRAPRPVLVTAGSLAASGFPTDGLVAELGPATRRWTAAYASLVAAFRRALATRDPRRLPSPARARAALTPVPPGVSYGTDLRRLAVAASRAGAAWAGTPADDAASARFAALTARAAAPRPADLRTP